MNYLFAAAFVILALLPEKDGQEVQFWACLTIAFVLASA